MRHLWIVAALVFVFIDGHSSGTNRLPPESIPKGFDFPRNGCELRKMLEMGDEHALRHHSWDVFAGMTQPAANQTQGGGTLPKRPIWLTWNGDAALAGRSPLEASPGHVHLEGAVQLHTITEKKGKLDACDPSALAVSVLFNDSAFHHIATPQTWTNADAIQDCGISSPATFSKPPTVMLNVRKSKDAYLDKLRPLMVSNVERAGIPAFPNDAVAVKAVWWLVPKGKYTVLPVWDGVPDGTASNATLPYCSWKRKVIVDPDPNHLKAVPPGAVFTAGEQIGEARTVSIRDFYFYEADSANAVEWNNIRSKEMPIAQPGDYLILVAMHFTTKEMVDWTWTTLWWHDEPNRGRFAEDRPHSVRNEWANYLMNISYDMDLPRESDGSPHICFNPWLEGPFPGGHQSNCMTCHRLAVWPSRPFRSSVFLPVTRGRLSADHPLFAGKAKLDFLWSLAHN